MIHEPFSPMLVGYFGLSAALGRIGADYPKRLLRKFQDTVARHRSG